MALRRIEREVITWTDDSPGYWHVLYILNFNEFTNRYIPKKSVQLPWHINYIRVWAMPKGSGVYSNQSMMTSSNGNVFRVTSHLCEEFTGHRWIPLTKARYAGLWCFFDLRLNERLLKQSWGWWFETQSRPLWRYCNGSGWLCKVVHSFQEFSN